MRKLLNILLLIVSFAAVACIDYVDLGSTADVDEVVAKVDDKSLTRSELRRDIPQGLAGADSVTFSRMYIDNWVLRQLKMQRAEEVLSSYEADIERLVEGYRQSLVMRQIDQYYIDHAIDPEIGERDIVAHYRANGARYKLDRHMVRGVVVKAPRSFRNTATLSTALRNVVKRGADEVAALSEKHSLLLSDMSGEWVSYSDFLSHLPTVRTRNYDDLLSKSGVQQMNSNEANFYFIITDVARRGDVAPIECVEEDIRRVLYAERCAAIVSRYEGEMLREAVTAGRIEVCDSLHMESLRSAAECVEPEAEVEVRDAEESIDDDVVDIVEVSDTLSGEAR